MAMDAIDLGLLALYLIIKQRRKQKKQMRRYYIRPHMHQSLLSSMGWKCSTAIIAPKTQRICAPFAVFSPRRFDRLLQMGTNPSAGGLVHQGTQTIAIQVSHGHVENLLSEMLGISIIISPS
uniref:Uncharacterized protein n=1 Tax=Ditylenchus dipsaci TaxID=166011 RepID=A0A915DYJ2_9BILA